jgi:hypothetical protein
MAMREAYGRGLTPDQFIAATEAEIRFGKPKGHFDGKLKEAAHRFKQDISQTRRDQLEKAAKPRLIVT